MQSFTLSRDGDRSLVFDGTLLGNASSERADAPRWFEIAIYRTEAGRYVVAGSGRSRVEGESDRCWAYDYTEPGDVVRRLTRVDTEGVEYITRTARDALRAAAELDDGLRGAFLKRVA